MKRVVSSSLALVLGWTIAGCNDGPAPLPLAPTAALIPNDPASAQPMQVVNLTFGPLQDTPAGTEFFIKVLSKGSADEIRFVRCTATPCTSATAVMIWVPGSYRTGDELRWRSEAAGNYYAWVRDTRDPAVWRGWPITAKERVGKRLRIAADSGGLLEAWYVTP